MSIRELIQKFGMGIATPVNLFTDGTEIADHFIDYTNGNSISFGGWYHSDYIDIEAYSTLYLNAGNTGGGTIGLAFYDDSYTYISGIVQTTSYSPFSVPATAKYIRFTGKNNVVASDAVILSA